VEDVRGPLAKFRGTNIPVEFAKWEEDLKEQMRLQWEEEQKSKKGKGGFGMFRVGGQQAEQPPVPIFEAQRQQFQEHFKRTHKAVEEEAAENLKKQKELEEKIKQMRVSVWDILTKVNPTLWASVYAYGDHICQDGRQRAEMEVDQVRTTFNSFINAHIYLLLFVVL